MPTQAWTWHPARTWHLHLAPVLASMFLGSHCRRCRRLLLVVCPETVETGGRMCYHVPRVVCRVGRIQEMAMRAVVVSTE